MKGEMASTVDSKLTPGHEHRPVVEHALRQQSGIPYEVEQKVCPDCRAVLGERTVRRAAA